MYYNITLSMYKAVDDEFVKDDPVLAYHEADTLGEVKSIDGIIWDTLADHEELRNIPVLVDGVVHKEDEDTKTEPEIKEASEDDVAAEEAGEVEDVEEDTPDPYEEDWTFVFYADIAEDEEGNIDYTGSTLSIQSYEDQPVEHFEPVKRVAVEEPGPVEVVGDEDIPAADVDTEDGPVEMDDAETVEE